MIQMAAWFVLLFKNKKLNFYFMENAHDYFLFHEHFLIIKIFLKQDDCCFICIWLAKQGRVVYINHCLRVVSMVLYF